MPLYRQHTGSTPLADPESGTDHSLKEVSAYIIWYREHTNGNFNLHTKHDQAFELSFDFQNSTALLYYPTSYLEEHKQTGTLSILLIRAYRQVPKVGL